MCYNYSMPMQYPHTTVHKKTSRKPPALAVRGMEERRLSRCSLSIDSRCVYGFLLRYFPIRGTLVLYEGTIPARAGGPSYDVHFQLSFGRFGR